MTKKDAEFVIDSLTKVFKEANIADKKLKMDVAIILEAMIVKHKEHEKTKKNCYWRDLT